LTTSATLTGAAHAEDHLLHEASRDKLRHGERILRTGAKDEAVLALKADLNLWIEKSGLDIKPLNEKDSTFDQRTAELVRLFQTKHRIDPQTGETASKEAADQSCGLWVDGKVGPRFYRALDHQLGRQTLSLDDFRAVTNNVWDLSQAGHRVAADRAASPKPSVRADIPALEHLPSTSESKIETGYDNGSPIQIRIAPVGMDSKGRHQVYLREDAAQAYIAMSQACISELGKEISINNGFRNRRQQDAVIALAMRGGHPAAPNGYSDHQNGTAIDLNVHADREVNHWLTLNAEKFGFVRCKLPGERHHFTFDLEKMDDDRVVQIFGQSKLALRAA